MGSFIDLHVHSNCSDGSYAPEELVWLALEKGLKVIALTDHDTVEGIPRAVAAAEGSPLKVVPGVEISSVYKGKEVHILGLFIDHENAFLKQTLQSLASMRYDRNSKICEMLRREGSGISMPKLFVRFNSRAMTRANIATYLIEEGFVKDKKEAFDKYRNMYASFGLGVKTGIDLPVESSGYTSKDKAAGNLLDFVMGQYETYTPMQLSQYITTIANGGLRLRPHLLKEIHSSSDTDEIGALEKTVETEVLNGIDTTPEYMARVRQGFIAVMNSPGGYGVGYMNQAMRPAGKTGTSQSFIDTDNDGRIDTETITSSFLGYAPYDNPKMSIMVTSPDSSHPNSNTNYASLVTYRTTQAITAKYAEMYGID